MAVIKGRIIESTVEIKGDKFEVTQPWEQVEPLDYINITINLEAPDPLLARIRAKLKRLYP